MRRVRTGLVPLVFLAASVPCSPLSARALTIEERIQAQRAIEEVRWSHRSWPKENPTPKPAFSTVMPETLLRAKVEDYLRKSNALEDLWQRPITAEQLQAEMTRMAKSTRDPGTLRELFASLGNDSFLIAETLARQTLADRLVRGLYSYDTRFHGETKRRAQRLVAGCAGIECMRSMGGAYTETTWVRRSEGAQRRDPNVLELEPDEWDAEVDRLARQFGNALHALPIDKRTALEETPDAFVVSAIQQGEDGRLSVASISWPKRTFDDWWAAERPSRSADVAPLPDAFRLEEPAEAECGEDPWSPTSVTGVPDDRRHNHTAIWTGTEMIVWGGQNGTEVEWGGGRYDPATDTWAPLAIGSSQGWKTLHVAVWTGTEMIVWGGLDLNNADLNTGARYNPVTDSWVAISTGTGVPTARRGATAIWTGSEMIVWGGISGGSTFRNTGGRYSPTTDSWTATSTTSVPAARWLHSAVWTGSEMIVWGGTNGSLLASGSRYNPAGNTWTATSTTNAPAARREHTAVWTGSRMIVWGGYNGSTDLSSGGRYDLSTNSWTATSTTNAPAPRRNHTAVWTDSEMIVWGGGNATNDLDSGGRYEPSGDTWTATSTGPNAPQGRSDHTAVWTGTEMIVWGGYDRAIAATVGRGARYDPQTDSWIAPAASATPAAQGGPPVWTGTEMIVWGGGTDNGPTNTGARYDPAIDTWTPTSVGAGVPGPRRNHTAIWTGSEMIVWGGSKASFTYQQDGGRYDPVQDTWRPTSIGPNVPAARVVHTAVWSGTEMIVWGGAGAAGLMNTGGRYEPLTDVWLPTSTGPNVPVARNFHRAVWAGPSGMLVWGGQISGGFLPSAGGLYDPPTDTWKRMTMTNAPNIRDGNSMVWTGMEMIIWSGFDAVLLVTTNAGGRYNPLTDTWSSTSTGTGVPTGRMGHVALWTGSDMVVWGGSTTPTGGFYEPLADTWTPTPTGPNVPTPRSGPSAVWTGTRLIVWSGGLPFPNFAAVRTGGILCVCATSQPAWADADCDGYGGPTHVDVCGPFTSCLASVGGDCNDGSSSIHPQAVEACNGLDDDCDASFDEDIPVPTESPLLLGAKSGSDAEISWPAVFGATSYDAVQGGLVALRNSAGDFTSSTTACAANDLSATSLTDVGIPAEGDGLWYLVRPVNACSGAGTYDEGSPSQVGSRDAGIAASGLACP